MEEPNQPYVLEKIKDVLNMMDRKPSSKNSLVVYNMILELKKDDTRQTMQA